MLYGEGEIVLYFEVKQEAEDTTALVVVRSSLDLGHEALLTAFASRAAAEEFAEFMNDLAGATGYRVNSCG